MLQGFRSAPAATADQLKEADELEARAKAANQSAEDSFQRSDTDGFLSQWASNISADKYRRQAEILRHGGCATFTVLVNDKGEVVADREFGFPHFKMRWVTIRKWRLPDDLTEKNGGKRWIPTGENSRVQKALGLKEDSRWYYAFAEITTGNSKSTGLAGAANAYVTASRDHNKEHDIAQSGVTPYFTKT